MRIGGLASGMDIDKLVDKLMTAERMPLDKMQQDRTNLTWKRDGFRNVNKSLLELDNMMLDMKLSSTYQSKSVSSSQENAVTATGTSKSTNGTYDSEVTQLASSAIRVSEGEIDDPDKPLGKDTKIKFSTYDTEKKEMVEHKVDVSEDDTLNSVLKKITDADNNVRAFYDSQSGKVIMETTRTGKYNDDGNEIDFGDSNNFFNEILQMGKESGGEDAEFKYHGIDMTSKENSYKLNDITFQFKNKTNGSAKLTVTNDVDAAFDSIMKFVDKYNEIVEKLNGTQQEEKHRDFKPLTDEQKKDMSDDEIKLWEEKAKSGILRGESAISEGLYSMRRSWYSNVETGSDLTSITQLGITTSSNYLDGGKLIVKDESKLKEALRNDPDSVYKLFSNSDEGDGRGIVNRLDDAMNSTINNIEERAGNGTKTLENYTLGKRMKDLNKQIDAFEDRLGRVEDRYWSQFTQMEKAIQQMNQQSNYLTQQFGGK